MEKQTVMITGGTGMVGRHLTQKLMTLGHRVIVLTRNPASQHQTDNLRFAKWSVADALIDENAFSEADTIIHLAGAGVMDKPWSPAYKKEIADSRIESGKLLIHYLQTRPNKVSAIVGASAIGWYGADGVHARPFVESDPPDPGFLGETCRLWEESIAPAAQLGLRLVTCRIGIVMANEGGALPEFLKPLRFRVAGIIGHGRQVVSWIHVSDLVDIFTQAVADNKMQGIFNAVAPNPVSNRDLNMALGKAKYGNSFLCLPIPATLLNMLLGERSIEILKSSCVSAQKLLDIGFRFQFPTIDLAAENLVGRNKL